MTEFYIHSRLGSPRSMRLLNLHPSKDSRAVLKCNLITASVDQLPSFEALSYAWEIGNGIRMHIQCQDKILSITENCGFALRRLRHRSKKRLLWVDAICIDQTSEEERNCQISLMKDIYERASLIIVWLGESTTESERFFMEIRTFSRHFGNKAIPLRIGELLSETRIRKIKKEWDATEDFRTFRKLDTLLEVPWIQDIFKRSWFHRMWTLQELALARDCLFVCGKNSASWDRVNQTITWLHTWPEFRGIQGEINMYYLLWRAVNSARTGESGSKYNYTLSEILTFSRQQSSTNPLDKIFGLFAVFNIYGLDIPDADYSKPVSRVYREATKAIMEHDRTLELLKQVCWTEDTAEWPSWVPNWEQTYLRTFPGKCNNATPGSSAIFNFSDDGTHLILSGRVIDTVKTPSNPILGVPNEKVDDPNSVAGCYMANCYIMQHWVILSLTVEQFQQEEGWGDAFCSMLLQGYEQLDLEEQFKGWLLILMTGSGELSHITEEDIDKTLAEIETVEDPIPNGARDWEGKEFLSHKIWKLLYEYRPTAKFHVNVVDTLMNHTFFLTAKSRMGIAPVVAEGDLVVLFNGFQYPMIVREADSVKRSARQFRLMGPAYVHGLMKGEQWLDGPDVLESFCII